MSSEYNVQSPLAGINIDFYEILTRCLVANSCDWYKVVSGGTCTLYIAVAKLYTAVCGYGIA